MAYNIEPYIKHYNDHYLARGESGSGTGEYKIKLQMWYDNGYNDKMTVLDYGCGWGAMIPGIKNLDNYKGVDISEEAIRLGKEKFPEADLEVMTPGELRLNKKYDLVVAQSVFTHTPKDSALECLLDIKRHIKGFAIIDVLHGNDNPSDFHVRHYTQEEWQDLVEQAGMKAEHIKSIQWAGGLHEYYKVS